MNMTRKLYTIKDNKRLYFSGSLVEAPDCVYDVEWEWTEDKSKALDIHLTDAWSFLVLTRRMFEGITFELERI